jgi:hypothetical protein
LCQKGASSACPQDEDAHVVRRLYHIGEELRVHELRSVLRGRLR